MTKVSKKSQTKQSCKTGVIDSGFVLSWSSCGITSAVAGKIAIDER